MFGKTSTNTWFARPIRVLGNFGFTKVCIGELAFIGGVIKDDFNVLSIDLLRIYYQQKGSKHR